MLKDTPLAPIRLLPPQLADQIAAGEVIERPASVLKELIENALDAGATRIDIDLQKGGVELIRVSDDGHGIPADEMTLAISRHATSKISMLDDLLRLHSLGFRGEALASICSVSQWEIASRTGGRDEAFRLTGQMPDKVLAANHARGTTVSIHELFGNTPARRKFLRTERTELRYCDDVIRRMALARFDVGFYVRHNGRFVHRLPAVRDDIGRTRRVAKLCGEAFIRAALALDFSHKDLRLHGWISNAQYSRQQTDLQFFYINGRIIRDRVINHAIRLAYQALLPTGRHAAYVLNLELAPALVDVNVHPTKHEVRFRETRYIHDFISRSLRSALQQNTSGDVSAGVAGWSVAETQGTYTHASTVVNPAGQQARSDDTAPAAEVLALLWQRYLLVRSGVRLFLIDAQCLHIELLCRDWQAACASGSVKSQPVLIPQAINLSPPEQKQFEQNENALAQCGFELTRSGPAALLLRAVPVYLRGMDVPALFPALLDCEPTSTALIECVRESLAQRTLDMQTLGFEHILRLLACEPDSFAHCRRELTEGALRNWLNARSHDDA